MKTTKTSQTSLAIVGRISALLFATIGILFFSSIVRAQDSQDDGSIPTFTAGAYNFDMGLNAGYRNVDITGQNGTSTTWAEERYYEALNLRSGLTVNTFNLFGELKRDANGNPIGSGFFDEMYLNADGIGDPFTNASFRMRQFNSYDLQIDFHNAKYFMDRNDSLYTGLHKYDDTRHFLNGSLTVNAASNLDLKVGVNTTGHTGAMTTTGSPYFEGDANGNDGTVSRGDFYWLTTPVNDQTNDYFLQALLKMSTTSVTVGGGYRYYTQTINYSPVNDTSLTFEPAAGVPNFSGIVGNTLVSNPLTSYMYNEARTGKTPYVYGQVVSKPVSGLSITADVRYEQTTQDVTTASAIGGLIGDGAKAKSFPTGANQNYIDSSNASATNTLKTLNASLTVSGEVTDQITLTGLWRYSHVDENSSGTLNESYDSESYVGSGKSVFANQYSISNQPTTLTTSIPTNMLEGFVNYAPISMLNLRVGADLTMRTPSFTESIWGDSASGAVTSANMSEKTQSVEEFFNFYYKPDRDWKFDGRVSSTSTKAYLSGTTTQVDDPIRLDPENLAKWTIAVQNALTHDFSWSLRYEGSKGSTSFMDMAPTVINDPTMNNNMQSFAPTLTYRFDKTTTLFASFEYRKNDFNTPSTFTRGNAIPVQYRAGLYGDSMTVSVDQHTIDRTYDLTFASKPMTAMHFSLGVTYLRSTGGANLTQYIENSAPDITRVGGPYTWIQAHATLGYDFIKNAGIEVNYQYVSLKEDIVDNYVGLNNFLGSLIKGSIYFRF